jgi:hypothetical protein
MLDHWILDGDRSLKKVDLMTWAQWFETNDRRLRREVAGGYWISTVFLGLNQQYGEGPPLIFETLVAVADGDGPKYEPAKTVEVDGMKIEFPCGGIHGVHMARYSTYDQAIEGHEAVVERIRGGWKPEDEE